MAPDNRAVRKMRDAESRARRKLRRLEGRGINAQSVSPIRPVDVSNRKDVSEYTKQLESFISRGTRFVRGRDGAAIPYSEWRDFQRAERRWNEVHDRMWGYFANHPYVSAGQATDMTARQVSQGGRNIFLRGSEFTSQVKSERFGSIGELRRLREKLEKEGTPQYWTYRMERLRSDLLKYAKMFPPEVEEAIRSLSNQQLFMLQQTSDFVEMYYSQIETNGDGEFIEGKRNAAFRISQSEQHLIATIKRIRRTEKPKGLGYYVRNDRDIIKGTEYETRLAEAIASQKAFKQETKDSFNLRKEYSEM